MSSVPPPDAPTHAAPEPAASTGAARRILRNTGILALSGLIVRGMGMGMMVLLARHLGAQGYGTYNRAEAFVYLFSILATLGLDMILTREVAKKSPRSPEFLQGVMTLKLVLGPLCFAVILGVAYARGYHGDFLWAIWCYNIVLLLTTLAQTYDAVFQGLDDMRYVAIANLVNQLAFVVLGGACVVLGLDLRWILAMLALAAGLRFAVSARLMARTGIAWAKPQPGTLLHLLRQSVPIAFASSFAVIYQQLDSVLLGELKGDSQVGWYKASAKFLLLFTVLRESFLTAVYPVFSSVMHTERERMGSLVTRAVRYQLIVALYFILCFVFLPRVAPKLLGEAFQNTATILPIMAWILVPQTISITLGRVLVASGNQKRIMVATGLALLVNTGLNLVLIPRFGYTGSAVAAAVSELAVAGVNVYYVQRFVARTHILRAIARPVLAAALVGLVLHLLPWLRLYQALPLAGVLYVAALLGLRTFTGSELVQFWTAVREGLTRARGSAETAEGGCDPRARRGDPR